MTVYKFIYIYLILKNIILAFIVNVCCVLHNVAKFYNVPEHEIYYDDVDMNERNEMLGNENRNSNDI